MKEIDELMNYCDMDRDGSINWNDFYKRFNLGLQYNIKRIIIILGM